ncbi:MAG TPA: cation-transporting P-type ATPase, partial [Acidimicrobiia bacterium]|nr:cation-transporting P-type ATPase [Acidimicrobiia bacterium]
MSETLLQVRSDWHARSSADVTTELATDQRWGLTETEAANRLGTLGPNRLGEVEEETWWEEALESIREPLQLLLLAVGVAYFVLGEIADALTILAVILTVSAIEVINELRAKRALEALRSLAGPTATVIRDGAPMELAASDLVPGDLVLLS